MAGLSCRIETTDPGGIRLNLAIQTLSRQSGTVKRHLDAQTGKLCFYHWRTVAPGDGGALSGRPPRKRAQESPMSVSKVKFGPQYDLREVATAQAAGLITEDEALELASTPATKAAAKADADAVAAAEPAPAAPTPSRKARKQGRRQNGWGHWYARPLDREAKNRLKVLLRALKRPTEPGKHYGELTGKAVDVALVLIFVFHNAASGLCFPSYEALAAEAGCNRSYVADLIAMLECAGIIGWVHRVERYRINGIVKTLRTSNGYVLIDPAARRMYIPEPREYRLRNTWTKLKLSSGTAESMYKKNRQEEATVSGTSGGGGISTEDEEAAARLADSGFDFEKRRREVNKKYQ
jgi:hypothetical protein